MTLEVKLQIFIALIVLLAAALAVVLWKAYDPRHREEQDRDARIPLEEDPTEAEEPDED